jgi:hypothetical protein
MVLLVLKLFVSCRPLKLEGVLRIYVLLLHEVQAENHFAMWWCGVDDVNNQPVRNPKRRYDEHSSKSSLSCETKVINLVGESQT